MGFLAGSRNSTWQPIMTADTTRSVYWLNWRFCLCVLWVLISVVLASLVVLKYEGISKSKHERKNQRKESAGMLYEHEAWETCLERTNPAWLLAFRIIAFIVLLALLIANVAIDGAAILYFYTQWTFALVTLYFGLGSIFSVYGCCIYEKGFRGDLAADGAHLDVERGTYATPALGGEPHSCKTAGVWVYIFQIIFQICAGAVVLTDCVFWFIIYPFLTAKDYDLNFLIVSMHSINVVLLLGDASLNSLRFPMFRIAYFVLWTSIFVVFHWIIHACVSFWWPYPFLDLASPYAPLWYLAIGLMHLPSYGLFALGMRFKQFLLSRSSST